MGHTIHVAAMGLALLVPGLAAPALDIPLKYYRNDRTDAQFYISSVKVADFDMLAAPAKPPVFQIDLRTSDIVRGLIRTSESETSAVTVGNRECFRERYCAFRVDDPTSACSKGELYVLIEYFDRGLTDTKIRLSYDSRKDERFNFHTLTDPVPIGATDQWKRHQFRLPNAFFGNRSGGSADFTVWASTEEEFFPSGSQYPPKSSSLPVGRWKLPRRSREPSMTTEDGWTVVGETSVERIPCYALVKLGDREHLCMLDFQSTASQFYDCIYFDANGNGDLTDDRILTATVSAPRSSGSSYSSRFDPIDMTIELNGRRLPYSFTPSLYAWMRQGPGMAGIDLQNLQFSIRSNCCYRGEFQADGKKWNLVLGDSGCNGRFDDILTGTQNSFIIVGGARRRYLTGDTFYLVESETPGYGDGVLLGRQLVLGSNLYDVTVNTPGNLLSLAPSSDRLATVNLPTATRSLVLYAEDTARTIVVAEPPGTEIRIPEGSYCIHSYSLARKDAEGDLWRLSASGSEKPTTVTADAREPNRLVYGEPYKITAKQSEYYSQRQPGSKQVELELQIEGLGGDLVSDVKHVTGTLTKIPLSEKQPDRPKEPTYKIARADGEIVADGNFEYG